MESSGKKFDALTPVGQEKQGQDGSNRSENKGINSIVETQENISYLGVALEKAKNGNGQFVPKREKYADFINDKEIALPLQRDIAVAFLSGDPLLVEGGTSLGKTTTIRKMAAELGWEVHYANLNGATDVEDLMGRYIPNPHKTNPEDPEYVFADGKVTSGLRQEEGKTKVIILDEFNASAPNILIRLHEVLDALERGGEVVLAEDASEAIVVSKGKTKVIALMNPPGKGYFGREPLDPAQLRRWIYKKLPSELPESTFSHSTDALFGADATLQDISQEMFLVARTDMLNPEQLQEIPGMTEILEKYKEFHKAAKELVRNRKIAADQPQPFSYDDRMEPRRVRDFILRFYNGDINESFQQALQYHYANKLENDADRKKLEELIRLVEFKPKVGESKRKGAERIKPEAVAVPPEIKRIKPSTKLEGFVANQIEEAIEILGRKNVLGPEEVEKTFGVQLDEIPEIPFSVQELEAAENLGQMLVLRINKTISGGPMSFEKMDAILSAKWQREGKGGLLNTPEGWEGFLKEGFSKYGPRQGWALVSKEVLPDSTSKNYIEQTEAIIKTLKEKAFKGMPLPIKYFEAINEFEADKARLTDLMSEDWQKAATELAKLKISQLTRPTMQEILYDLAMYYDHNNERLLSNMYAWSCSVSPYGRLMSLGRFGVRGVIGSEWLPYARLDDLGVSFSRRL